MGAKALMMNDGRRHSIMYQSQTRGARVSESLKTLQGKTFRAPVLSTSAAWAFVRQMDLGLVLWCCVCFSTTCAYFLWVASWLVCCCRLPHLCSGLRMFSIGLHSALLRNKHLTCNKPMRLGWQKAGNFWITSCAVLFSFRKECRSHSRTISWLRDRREYCGKKPHFFA